MKALVTLTRLAGDSLTHSEFNHWRDGRAGGSRQQTWSAAGYEGLLLAIAGLTPKQDGLYLEPCVPDQLREGVKIEGVPCRGATLDVSVRGSGTRLRALTLDGRPVRKIPPGLAGHHVVAAVVVDG